MAQVTQLGLFSVPMAKRPAFVAKATAGIGATDFFKLSDDGIDFKLSRDRTAFKLSDDGINFKLSRTT